MDNTLFTLSAVVCGLAVGIAAHNAKSLWEWKSNKWAVVSWLLLLASLGILVAST